MRQFPPPYGVLLLRHETARIHPCTRRDARVASRGASGADRPNTARWRADGICRNRSSGKSVARGVHPRGFGVWLDRGPESAHGRPLGTWKYRSDAYIRKRVSQPAAGRDSNTINAGDCCCEARDLDIPIVFAAVADPVGSGFVASLSRPGGNVTGFGSLDQGSMASKWLELLTAIAPSVKRAVMMFNPDTAPYMKSFLLPSFEAAAGSLKIASAEAPVHNETEIEAAISSLGREPGSGLLGMPDNFIEIHRALIISLAARNSVPAVYQTPIIARDGGLLSYGAEFQDIFHRSARYIDNILRGAKPSELPVQLPAKYFMVVNSKTAKALGLTVPPTLLATADEVIE
jgi:putative tryptophan/tyrosine transport system substrate-binding protein